MLWCVCEGLSWLSFPTLLAQGHSCFYGSLHCSGPMKLQANYPVSIFHLEGGVLGLQIQVMALGIFGGPSGLHGQCLFPLSQLSHLFIFHPFASSIWYQTRPLRSYC